MLAASLLYIHVINIQMSINCKYAWEIKKKNKYINNQSANCDQFKPHRHDHYKLTTVSNNKAKLSLVRANVWQKRNF